MTAPTLRHIIAKDDISQLVSGVTSLNDRLFVIRYPSRQRIAVYDVESFALLRHLVIDGLHDAMWWRHPLTSCADRCCLYVADYRTSTVHRIDVSDYGTEQSQTKADGATSTKSSSFTSSSTISECQSADDVVVETVSWQTGSCPTGLSVCRQTHHLLVTCCSQPYRIQRFTTDGFPVGEVRLEAADITYPFHAVRLPSNGGHYLVSHEGPSTHGVSVVSAVGRVLSRLRPPPSSGQYATMKCPRQLVADETERMFLVADRDNNRIVRLAANGYAMPGALKDMRAATDSDVGLDAPVSLCLDEARGRLYVGEWRGGRVLIFDILIKCDQAKQAVAATVKPSTGKRAGQLRI